MVNLSRSKTFNSNNKMVKERMKVDVELNARSRTCSKSSRPHVRMFKKSEHEQEMSNESFMYDKMVCWCDTQEKEKSQETLGGLTLADCV